MPWAIETEASLDQLELDDAGPYPIANYKEVVLNEEDTLDVKIADASYDVT